VTCLPPYSQFGATVRRTDRPASTGFGDGLRIMAMTTGRGSSGCPEPRSRAVTVASAGRSPSLKPAAACQHSAASTANAIAMMTAKPAMG
jgi:hypothetical protein